MVHCTGKIFETSEAMDEKKLLNEILPTPEYHVSKNRPNPRARTLNHLQKLMAGASTIAALCGCGFAVVDPLPPPSRCPDVIQKLTAQASFIQQNNIIVIELRLTPADADIVLSQGSFANGTNVISETLDPNTGELVIILEAPAAATSIQVIVNANCLNVFGTFQITLDAPVPGNAGDPINTSIEAPENF